VYVKRRMPGRSQGQTLGYLDPLFKPGECYFMPIGFNGIWRQSLGFRNIHMTASTV